MIRLLATALCFLSCLPLALAAEDWQITEQSRLSFEARLSGGSVNGAFPAFSGRIRFSEDDLAGSEIVIKVDLSEIEAPNADALSALKSADFFNVDKWPAAMFSAKEFARVSNGKFVARGALSIRDLSHELELPFTLKITADPQNPKRMIAKAAGELTLMRLDFGVGQGQWAATTMIANEVIVRFQISASREVK